MADRYQSHPGAAGARDYDSHQRGAESDPLAELARLIGQTDPNAKLGRANHVAVAPQAHQHYEDQYADQLAEHPAEPTPPSWMRATSNSSWPQQPAPTMHQQHQAPHGFDDDRAEEYPQAHQHAPPHPQAYPQHQADQYADDAPAFLRAARQRDPARYDDVLYDQNSQNAPQYADGQYQQNYDYQDQADPNGYPPAYADDLEEPKRKRGGLMTVAAVLALAVVGTAGAYGYRSFTGPVRSGEPPVIKAETGANKVVPPTQTSDASGKIADRMGAAGSGQERVLSREEQPIDINGRAPRVVFPPTSQASGAPVQTTAMAQAAPVATIPAAQPSGTLNDEPKRVRTVAVRPDQPDAVPSGTAPPSRPTQARAQAPASGGPVSLSPQGGSSPSPAPVRTAAATSTGGGFMVQVSSQRSEADAQASYRAVQSKFPNVLGSHSASIRRADLGEKGVYYRALVGPFAAAEEAGNLCNSLRSAGGSCVVQRN
jgi:hypothetical protein